MLPPLRRWLILLLLPCAHAEESTALDPLFRLLSGDFRRAVNHRAELRAELDRLPLTPSNQQSARLGFQIMRNLKPGTPFTGWVEIDLGSVEPIDAVVLVPVDAPYRDFSGPGYGFPRRFRVEVTGGDAEHILADHTADDFPNPGGLPVYLPAGMRGRRIRIALTKPWSHGTNAFIFALGEIMVLRGNRNLAAGLPSSSVTASESIESEHVWSQANLIDGQSLLGPPVREELSGSAGYHSRMSDSANAEKWVQVDLGQMYPLQEIRLIGARVPQFPGRAGFGFPPRFKVEADDNPRFEHPILLADETARDFVNPSSNPVTIRAHGVTARYVRMTATRLWERAVRFTFALAEMQVYAGDRNVAHGRPVTALDQFAGGGRSWLPAHLTDGGTSQRKLVEWPEWLRSLSRRREALRELAAEEKTAAGWRSRLMRQTELAAGSIGAVSLTIVLLGLWRARRRQRQELEQLRQQIARDLHDEIGSNLSTIALLSEMAMSDTSGQPHRDFQEIHRVVRQTADSMRDIVGLMRHPAATAPEFVDKLDHVAQRMLVGLERTFSSAGCKTTPALDMQRHLLLAFKEALHNIRKHAAARCVTIHVAETAGTWRLEITDDGGGFDPTKAQGGQGLANLRHRATALGGEIRIESREGRGTRLTLIANLHHRLRA